MCGLHWRWTRRAIHCSIQARMALPGCAAAVIVAMVCHFPAWALHSTTSFYKHRWSKPLLLHGGFYQYNDSTCSNFHYNVSSSFNLTVQFMLQVHGIGMGTVGKIFSFLVKDFLKEPSFICTNCSFQQFFCCLSLLLDSFRGIGN